MTVQIDDDDPVIGNIQLLYSDAMSNNNYRQTQIQRLLNIDFFSFLAEISTTESELSYSKLYFGGIERGEIIPSTSPGFIGYISQVFFNGQKFFELSRAGQLDASLKETNNAKKGIA